MSTVVRLLRAGLIVIICASAITGQCALEFDAGPDRLFCQDGEAIQLQATVSSPAFGLKWEAHPTLQNEQSLTPTVRPTRSTDYVLTVYQAEPEDNLIVNGDFEDGNVGFYSEYDYEPGGESGPITPGGSYSITRNSNDAHSAFNSCSDYSGSGYMMACNGSTQANSKVWCQTVTVEPNTTYVLRAYIASIWRYGAAELQFSVNDELVGPVNRPSIDPPCQYTFFDERWRNETTTTSARICVVNQTTDFFGYNFALDDIFFAPICVESDTVRVTVVDTDFDLDPRAVLLCNQAAPGLYLAGQNLPQGPGYTYEWSTTDGSIISNPSSPGVTVDAPGAYTLTTTYTEPTGETCSTSKQINVSHPPFPTVTIAPPIPLNCRQTSRTLTGYGSTTGTGYRYEWTTAGGQIVGPANRIIVQVEGPGTYTLTITEPGGCTNSETVHLEQIGNLPEIQITAPSHFTCDDSVLTLNAAASDQGANMRGSWTAGAGGHIMPDAVSDYIVQIDQGGEYHFRLTDLSSGCTSQQTVQITGQPSSIEAIATASSELRCFGDTVSLSAATSITGPGVAYRWSSNDGGILGSANSAHIATGVGGTYVLQLTDPAGCTSSDTLTLAAPESPDISLPGPPLLTCDRAQITLRADISNAADYELAWASEDGQIDGPTNTTAVNVSAAGAYELTLTNPATGCRFTHAVTVNEDREPPRAQAATPPMLTCTRTSVKLADNGSSSGPDYLQNWFDPAGELLAEPRASQPGNYVLKVRNTSTGCITTDTVQVEQDDSAPENLLGQGPPLTLTCRDTTFTLSGGAGGTGLAYAWSTPPANADQFGVGPSITATSPGVYSLSITNPITGCSTSATRLISGDFRTAEVVFQAPGRLDCRTPEVVLEATLSDEAATYTLIGPDGNSLDNGLHSRLGEPGNYTLHTVHVATGCSSSASVVISQQRTPPLVEAGPDARLDCRQPELQLTGNAVADAAAISYSWEGPPGSLPAPGDSAGLLVSQPGLYRLRVTNEENGCSGEDSVRITVDHSAPQFQLARTQVLSCVDRSHVLNVAGLLGTNYDYSWTSPAGTELGTSHSLPVEDAGTYRVLVTDPDNGCQRLDSVVVTQDTTAPNIKLEPIGKITCLTTTIKLDASGGEYLNGARFEWVGPDLEPLTAFTGDTCAALSSGRYLLTVTHPENGCRDTISLSVEVDTFRPTAQLLPTPPITCRDTSVALQTAPASRQSTYRYDWLGNGAFSPEPAINTTQPGTFALRVRDVNNNCVQTLPYTVRRDVSPPLLSPPAPATLTCTNPTALGQASLQAPTRTGIQLFWSTTNGQLPARHDGLGIETSTPGRYRLTSLDTLNGCRDSIDWLVAENRASPQLSLPAEIDQGCDPTPAPVRVTATAAGPLRYHWQTNDGTISGPATTAGTNLDGAGDYRVVVTDLKNGCTSEAVTTVRQQFLDPLAYEFTPPDCSEASGRLHFNQMPGGEGPYLFSTDGGQTYGAEPLITNLVAGTYQLRIQDARGCEVARELSFSEALPLSVDLVSRVDLLVGDSVALAARVSGVTRGLDTVAWSSAPGLSCYDCLTPVAKPTQTSTYRVVVTTLEGCQADALIDIRVDRRIGVYFPTAFSPNGDGQNDWFGPMADESQVVRVRDFAVFDRWGSEMFRVGELGANELEKGWDGRSPNGTLVATGVYVYTAEVEFVYGGTKTFTGSVTVVR